MKSQKGFAWLPVLLGLVVLAAIGGGAYMYQKNQHKTDSIDVTLVPAASSTPTINKTSSIPKETTHNSSNFTVTQNSGTAPLAVTFKFLFDVNAMGAASDQFVVDFGDGTQGEMSVDTFGQITHTYTAAGTYMATISFKNSVEGPLSYTPLKDSSGNPLTQTIIVNVSNAPSATIDASSLQLSPVGSNKTITGSASNASSVRVHVVLAGKEDSTNQWDTSYANEAVSVLNGRWSITIPAADMGCNHYDVAVYTSDKTLLTKGAFLGTSCGD